MSAREEAIELIRYAYSEGAADDYERATSDLAARLGAELRSEIKAELQQEHEDDLVRARTRSFDLGVRSSLQALVGRQVISAEDRDRYTVLFDAGPTIDLDALRAELVPILGPGNDDDAATSQATAVVEIVRRMLP